MQASSLSELKAGLHNIVLLSFVQSAAVRGTDYVSKTQTLHGVNGSCKFSRRFHTVHVQTAQDRVIYGDQPSSDVTFYIIQLTV